MRKNNRYAVCSNKIVLSLSEDIFVYNYFVRTVVDSLKSLNWICGDITYIHAY